MLSVFITPWQKPTACHCVMNTDNMSVLGLTIDYGPFGFLDAFDPGHVCNHSDHQGRYAFARQPNVARWNLHALAQALLPLLGAPDEASERALEALEPYRNAFAKAMLSRMSTKLGLAVADESGRTLADELLQLMASDRADLTITMRRLGEFDSAPGARNEALRDLFMDRAAFDAWASHYGKRLRAEGSIDAERRERMRRVNPRVVLRNHLAETAIRRAGEGDFSEVERLLNVLARPFDEPAEPSAQDLSDAGFPPDWAHAIEVSCSS
jgi:uncharacterized protein YdiU (UPF0061 family)